MAKIKSSGLNRRTLAITTEFFENIKKFDKNDPSNYQLKLFHLVEKFFQDMNRFDETELASLLAKHQFDHLDSFQQEKYNDAFKCLVAFIVGKYNESDLLRYFLPKEYSIENKPRLTSDSWRIVYWAKFLTYWLGSKLFNRQKFIIQEDKKDLALSIAAVKGELHEQNYFDLKNQNTSFNKNLTNIVQEFVANRHPMLTNIPALTSTLSTEPATATTSSMSSVVLSAPPAPPIFPSLSEPNLLNLPKNDPQQSKIKSTDEKTVDRSDLLAAIRKGIKLKPKGEQKDLSKKPVEISKENLAAIIKNALQDKFKNVNSDEDDNSDEDENQKNENDGWNTYTDCVDSAGTQQPMFFAEIDVDQIDAVMKDLEQNIPQDFELKADQSAEIIAKKVIDSIMKQEAAKQQDQANDSNKTFSFAGLFGKRNTKKPDQQHNRTSYSNN